MWQVLLLFQGFTYESLKLNKVTDFCVRVHRRYMNLPLLAFTRFNALSQYPTNYPRDIHQKVIKLLYSVYYRSNTLKLRL